MVLWAGRWRHLKGWCLSGDAPRQAGYMKLATVMLLVSVSACHIKSGGRSYIFFVPSLCPTQPVFSKGVLGGERGRSEYRDSLALL